MSATEDTRSGKEWLSSWNPEDEATWDKRLAWQTHPDLTLLREFQSDD